MDVIHIERSRYQWESAADSMPQLICLLDREGRIIRANRTIERWKLNKVENVGGMHLHELMHQGCINSNCDLKHLGRLEELAEPRCARRNVWDPVLNRQLIISIQLCVDHGEPVSLLDGLFAIVTIDDVTAVRASKEKAKRTAKILSERVKRESEKRLNAERIQARLLAIFDKTPSLVAIANRNGMACYLNPAGRQLLKLGNEAEMCSVSLSDCHAAGMWQRISEEAMPQAARAGLWTGDSILVAGDGSEIRTSLTLIAHSDHDGQVEGFTFLESDMTDWTRTEEALRISRAQLQRLAAQHLSIQELERKRVASDLHDGLGQSLSLLKMKMQSAVKAQGAGDLRSALRDLVPKVKTVLDELRTIAMNLRPAIIDEVGIRATISWFIREIEDSSAKIRFELNITIAESDVPEPLKIAIFRIIQEATNNALKHSRAAAIKVGLNLCGAGDIIELCIEDNGAGFDPGKAEAGALDHGLGLQSMRERAELSGATFELTSAVGEGTKIRVCWPCAKKWSTESLSILARTGRPIRSVPSVSMENALAKVMRSKGGLAEVAAVQAVPLYQLELRNKA